MERIVAYGRIYEIPHEVETAEGDNRAAIAQWANGLLADLASAAQAAGVRPVERTIGEGTEQRTILVLPDLPAEIHDRVIAVRTGRANVAAPAVADSDVASEE